MPTFVEITPDAFGATFATVSREQGHGSNFGRGTSEERLSLYQGVRRPVRGIQIKDDTYATLQVKQSNGQAMALFDGASASTSGRGTRNSNFLVQSVQEQRVEKQQIVQTFGEPYIFFFGEQPRIISVSGVLLNTEDFNWRAEWWENYDKYLRGTACVRSRSRVYLSWDDIVVEGYLMQANAQEQAPEPNYVRFEFQMFLTNYQNISNIGGIEAYPYTIVNLEATTEFVNSLGQGESSTLAVRERNVAMAEALAEGSGKNSLLSSLRIEATASAFEAGTSRLVAIEGQVLDILAQAGRFVAGRNIRVPIGFEGSAVFDDAQIALASIPNAAEVITGDERTVSISRTLAGHSFTIKGSLGRLTAPSTSGATGKLYENVDEFVARFLPGPEGPIKAHELYRDQMADNDSAIGEAEKAFKAFGIELELPDESKLLFRRVMFGIAGVAAGMNLNKLKAENETARFVTNLL